MAWATITLCSVAALAAVSICFFTLAFVCSWVRIMTRSIVGPVRVNCWSHCSNEPAAPTGWDWFRSLFFFFFFFRWCWLYCQISSLSRSSPTGRMKCATENMCDSITKRRRPVRSVFSMTRNSCFCVESNYFACPQKISVQEYFLGNVAQKSQSTETGIQATLIILFA